MNKLDELKKKLYTDTSDRWVSSKDVDTMLEALIVGISENLLVHSTAFDGDVSRGIKIAARLVKEQYLQETP